MTNPKSQKANEYLLITGELTFIDPENENAMPNSVRSNGIMVLDERKLSHYALGKAQQVLQANFHKKMGEVQVTVVDVVLLNFEWLGRMTQGEFEKLPPGIAMRERTDATETGAPEQPSSSTAAIDAVAPQ